MIDTAEDTGIPLALAAQRLAVSWHRAWRLGLTGRLDMRKVQGRMWVVSEESLARYQAEQRAARPVAS